jgi:hypothetical protein
VKAEKYEVVVEESFVPFLQLQCFDHNETYFQQDAAAPSTGSTVPDVPNTHFPD